MMEKKKKNYSRQIPTNLKSTDKRLISFPGRSSSRPDGVNRAQLKAT